MKENVGGLDRIVRILAGVSLVSLAAMNLIGPWGWLGVIPLGTGFLRWCPAYTVFGFSSCKHK